MGRNAGQQLGQIPGAVGIAANLFGGGRDRGGDAYDAVERQARNPAPYQPPAAQPAAPAYQPPPAPVLQAYEPPPALQNFNADVENQRNKVREENTRLSEQLEATKRKTAVSMKRTAKARTGNIFEEGAAVQSPYSRKLGGG